MTVAMQPVVGRSGRLIAAMRKTAAKHPAMIAAIAMRDRRGSRRSLGSDFIVAYYDPETGLPQSAGFPSDARPGGSAWPALIGMSRSGQLLARSGLTR